jgi:glucose-1-phosphate adenylyltransferase
VEAAMHDVIGFILGGGRGAGLYPLTRHRSAPAVPVAGKYRLIDIPISNCINNGLQRIYVLTQFLSVSLHRHIANTYKFAPFSRGFVEVLAAQQTNEGADWYQGTADALRQNLRYLTHESDSHVLILSGDGLYRMNLREMLHTHTETRADATVAVVPVPRSQASRVGIVRPDGDNRLVEFVEKPQTPQQLDALKIPPERLERHGINPAGREHLANMGVYLYRRDFLVDLLRSQAKAVDLVTELLVPNLSTHQVQTYLFDGYWQDVGTIKAYHEANLALASDNPPFDFHSPEGVIYTHMRNLPASQVRAGHVSASLISDACLIEHGARLERCVVGLRTHIGRDAVLRDVVITGADRFETAATRESDRALGIPAIGVGERTVVERAILDKNCRIGPDVRIINQNNLREAEGENYVIRDGIVIIPKEAVVPAGTVI